jgi:hypothetical protein
MSWQDAVNGLKGHLDWWWFDYNCRDDADRRDECRELAIKAAQERPPVSIGDRAAGVSVGCCGQILPT